MQEQNIDKQPAVEIPSAEAESVNVNPQKSDISLQNTMDKPCACGEQSCSCGSEGGKMLNPSYVYAIGKVVHRFPTRSLELELAQATGRRSEEETRSRTREEVIHKALTDPANRYIARQICYVLTIEGLETYILVPTDPLDIDRLAQALAPSPGDVRDIDVIVGRRGP